ncbi:MAG: Nif3-like dinuclear metal center hexameric protein [Polyangiaceae bacterium]|nr:Nif3-like dinuclear metal center hexameric protein [Polyangiaceae bacterium]
MHIRDLVEAMEGLAPTRFAESWDNVGLIIGDDSASLSRVLLTIDLGLRQLEEAKELGCDAVVAYHPPIFKNLRKVVGGTVVYEAVRLGIAVHSPHTALDVASGGTNDSLAGVLGLVGVDALRPAPNGPGMGRVGRLDPPEERLVVLERIKTRLGVDRLLVAGPTEGLVRVGAVCAGACGEMVERALELGADLYLTGEMRHHDALRAAGFGMTVVCALHSNSERHVLVWLREQLLGVLPRLSVSISQTDSDPFAIR